jgi:periplasmic mercuric ion binding protein
MKTIIILFIGLIFSLKIQAQTTVTTTTISVKGNCGECKERIENAADIKGVKVCKWDEKTQVATITFDSSKVTIAKIEATIAKAGHETKSAKADDKAYKSLPECCKYKDGECKK